MKAIDVKLFEKGTFDVVKTDCSQLNTMIGGGLRTDNLYVLQAPSGTGKTTFMMRLAINCLKQGKKVMYISAGEQDNREIIERILCMETGIDYEKFVEKYDDNEVKKCWNVDFLENLYINYSDNPFTINHSTNLNDMYYFLKEAEEENIKFIFFDYLGSCMADNEESNYSFLTSKAAFLKNYASNKHVCIFTAMQTNRYLLSELKKNNVDYSMLNEEFMADSVGPARKCCFGMTLVKENDKRYHLNVFKNRLNGKLGEMVLQFEPYTFRWLEYFMPKKGF